MKKEKSWEDAQNFAYSLRGLSISRQPHAFGTHLYENGTDLLTIKALLGHKSLNSTTIYVHLASNGTANAVSPFDRMGGVLHE